MRQMAVDGHDDQLGMNYKKITTNAYKYQVWLKPYLKTSRTALVTIKNIQTLWIKNNL